ncbi:MAG: GTPase HflX [Candidatus Fermentibacter sp.]|nr:GTPase HflX [Candidatus Fermentibacter sp.]
MPARACAQEREATGEELFLAVAVTLGNETPSPGAPEELASLVHTAGGRVVGFVTQNRPVPDHATFVGKGKLEEIKAAAQAGGVSSIVFDHNLSPAQVSRLEEATECKVLDRTELIMSIFAGQARTAEAKLQVELAQLKYALPRLSGMWHHFSRLGGGIGTRGPGETQLEVDRRKARTRIRLLEKELEKIAGRRDRLAGRRSEAFSVALAGYTNTGKSTLLNRICGSGAYSADRLFATLDSTTRRLYRGGAGSVVFSDTVGFIERLPEGLVASFYSTLAVVRDADLVLVVGDASHPCRDVQNEAVKSTLERIGAGSVPRLMVWNKIDIADPGSLPSGGLLVSALTGRGVDELLSAVEEERRSRLEWFTLRLLVRDGRLENWIHENCVIGSFESTPEGVEITAGALHGFDSVVGRLSGIDESLRTIERTVWSQRSLDRGRPGRDG